MMSKRKEEEKRGVDLSSGCADSSIGSSKNPSGTKNKSKPPEDYVGDVYSNNQLCPYSRNIYSRHGMRARYLVQEGLGLAKLQ